jgi:outer membrane receptor protein involved in Fe transport
MSIVRIAALAALVPFAAARAQQATARQGALDGVVRDAKSQLPLADVTIRVEGTTRGAMSDADGRWRVPGVPAGRWAVLATRIGYAPRRDSVTVAEGAVVTLELALREAAVVVAPVVVSATREEQKRAEGTSTIEVLDGAEIRRTRAAHPAQLMNRLAGVHVSELAGEGHSTAIRQPISTKPLYLYLEDGIPTRSTGFFNHNALYEVNMPQAGGLEVLKGPGTALYGSDAIGGVVNVLTRPAPATPSVDVTTEGGSYGYRRVLATGGFTSRADGVRADLNLTRSGGWRDDASYDRQSATVRWDHFRGGFSSRTVVTASRIDQHDVPALTLAQFDARSTLNRSPIAFRTVEALRASTALELDRGATLWSVTPYARRNVLALLPNWQLTYNPQRWDTRNTSFGLLAKVRRDFAPMKARVIAGVDMDLSPGSQVVDQLSAPRTGADSVWASYAVTSRSYDYDVEYRQLSPYLHTELSPLSRLRVDLGARWDMSGYAYENNLSPLDTGRLRRPADTALHYRHLSPKAGATFRVSRAANVYASYRHGFRAPNQSALFQQGAARNTVDLEPVKVDSREGGIRGELGTRVAYQLAAYDMTIRDDIYTYRNAQNQQVATNAGETRHKGVEASVGIALLARLRLDASWTRASHRYVEWLVQDARPASGSTPAVAEIRFDGNRIAAAPRSLGNALVTWTPALLKGGRIAAEYTRVGSYAMDEANTPGQVYGGYDLVNLHANAMLTPHVELFVRASNVFDRNYAEVASYSAAERNAAERATFTPGAPRQAFAGIRWEWAK